MERVFLDANVFFAATRSPKGGSGFILELAKRRKLEIITTTLALIEAEENIKKKLGNFFLIRYYQNLIEINPKIQSIQFITPTEIRKFKEILPTKDIPILLGTIFSRAEFLITLDKKHFLNNEKLKNIVFPLEIINPGEFLKKFNLGV